MHQNRLLPQNERKQLRLSGQDQIRDYYRRFKSGFAAIYANYVMDCWWVLWLAAILTQMTSAFTALILTLVEFGFAGTICRQGGALPYGETNQGCTEYDQKKAHFFLGAMLPFTLLSGFGAVIGLRVSLYNGCCCRLRCTDIRRVQPSFITKYLVTQAALSGSAFLYGLFPLLLGMMQSHRSHRVAGIFVALVGSMPILLSTAMGGLLALHYLQRLQTEIIADSAMTCAANRRNQISYCNASNNSSLQNNIVTVGVTSEVVQNSEEQDPDSVWFLSDSDVLHKNHHNPMEMRPSPSSRFSAGSDTSVPDDRFMDIAEIDDQRRKLLVRSRVKP